MAVGISFTVTAKIRDVEGQFGAEVYLFTTLTDFAPEEPAMLTVICFVPATDVMVQPEGTVQSYCVVPP